MEAQKLSIIKSFAIPKELWCHPPFEIYVRFAVEQKIEIKHTMRNLYPDGVLADYVGRMPKPKCDCGGHTVKDAGHAHWCKARKYEEFYDAWKNKK